MITQNIEIEERTGYVVEDTGMLIGAPCCCFGDDHRGHPYCDEPTKELLEAERDGLIVRHLQGVWRWFVVAA